MQINIATPQYGHSYEPEYVQSLYSMTKKLEQAKIPSTLSWVSFSDIVVSRNYLISNFYFLQKSCSHILFIDADMGFPPELIMDMISFNKPLVGVMAPTRHFDPRRPGKGTLAVGNMLSKSESDFVKVSHCGASILLISRECIDKMVKQIPDFLDSKHVKSMPFGGIMKTYLRAFDPIVTDNEIFSEDISFCKRWIERCKGDIWVNSKYKIDHIGRYVFSNI